MHRRKVGAAVLDELHRPAQMPAAAAVTTWSAIPPCAFPPNPPPTCGVITRTVSSGTCSERAKLKARAVRHLRRQPHDEAPVAVRYGERGVAFHRSHGEARDPSSVRTTISLSKPGGSPSDGQSSGDVRPCSGKSTGAPGATAAATSRTTGNGSQLDDESSAAVQRRRERLGDDGDDPLPDVPHHVDGQRRFEPEPPGSAGSPRSGASGGRPR